MKEPKEMDLSSMDVAAQKRDELKLLLVKAFPEVFSEGSIDFDQFKRVLGEWVEPSKERFGLNWPGKAACMRVVQQPSIATLKPIREESVNFDETDNLFIEGDNLEVLKLLQKAYFGKVKMIYIDPPYNTGKEFIYPDKFSETLETYLEYTGQVDSTGKKFTTNTDAAGRFHSNWMNMMYPRLYLSKNLLREDGVIFISIGENEVQNLRLICNEIFGENNFLGCAARVSKKANNQGDFWSPNFDYILTYAKEREACKPFFGGVNYDAYDQIEAEGPRKGEKYQLVRLYMTSLDPMRGCTNQRYYIECPDGSFVIPPGNVFPDEKRNGAEVLPQTGADKVWRWSRKTFEQEKDRIVVKRVRSSNLVDQDGSPAQWNVFTKTYLKDVENNATAKPNSLIENHINQISSHELSALGVDFDFAKPSTLISYLIEISRVQSGDIVLDYFAGSGSTAHGVLSKNSEDGLDRKFILVQLPEPVEDEGSSGFDNIADIAKERIRRVADSIQKKRVQELDLVGNDSNTDSGFRTFELGTSNFKIWGGDAQSFNESGEQLSLHVKHVCDHSSSEDILYELLLKAGFPLSTKVKSLELAGVQVFSIEDGALLICLGKNITPELIDAIAAANPLQVICLDEGFEGNDQLKANAVQTFKARAQAEESEIVFRTV